ncbi:hypothetical protein DL765_007252 [Monosporascus sp. GIB2]|nr:hypothetical protein DL765_007252 [Monosporascus sp. GIB2]
MRSAGLIRTPSTPIYMRSIGGGGLLSTYCAWTVRDALESTPSTQYAAPDCHVSAAARGILCSGQAILREVLVPSEDDDSLLGGPLALDAWGPLESRVYGCGK